MKNIGKLITFFLIALILSSCGGKGPSETQVTKDIRANLIKKTGSCAFGKMHRTIQYVSIVGKQERNGVLIYQAKAGVYDTGPCSGAGELDLEVTIAYEKFGDGWRPVRYGFDYKIV